MSAISLFSQKKIEKEITNRDIALNDRLSALEEKTHSILQENTKIDADLNEARTLYQKRQQELTTAKNLHLDEITPLENTVKELTSSIATISQTNSTLSTNIDTARTERDRLHRIWLHLQKLW